MWIKKIIYKINNQNKILDDLNPNKINCIIGGSNTGKTLILKNISEVWKNAIDNKLENNSVVKYEIRHINTIMNCPEEKSNKSIREMFITRNNDVSCGILFYPTERCSYEYENIFSTTDRLFHPIINDINNHSIHNSIIIIDDIDLKPNKNKISDLISNYLLKAINNSNQIIISISDEKLIEEFNKDIKLYHLEL